MVTNYRDDDDICTAKDCDWLNVGHNLCVNGADGTCLVADLLDADATNFHDKRLIEATTDIKMKLDKARTNANGRKLAFLLTDFGILLSWVETGEPTDGNIRTTRDSDPKSVIKALDLKNVVLLNEDDIDTNESGDHDCSPRNCDWVILDEKAYCVPGSGGCLQADLLEAHASEFHDAILMETTMDIKNLIDKAHEESDDRKLAFFITEFGILLSWAETSEPIDSSVSITRNSDPETVIEVLKLKNVSVPSLDQ